MVAFVFSSTMLGTPTEYRSRGLLDAALLGINLSAFTITYGVLRLRNAWAEFTVALFVSSLFASGLLAARAVFVARSGVFMLSDSYILGLGTVTGTFTAAFAAAAVTALAFATSGHLRIVAAIGVGLHGIAAGLALARGPWLAFAVAVLTSSVVIAST